MLSKKQKKLLKKVEKAEKKLAADGFYVFRSSIRYLSSKSGHFADQISTPGTGAPRGEIGKDSMNEADSEFDHAFADAIRDLCVEWHNMRHTHQLIWTEDQGKKAKKTKKR